MSKFLTNLHLRLVLNDQGQPLKNRTGRQLYQIDSPVIYQSDIGGLITVPIDFVTDLASIPRIPVVYLHFNGIADLPGVIHDYLYSTAIVSRQVADNILKEACLVWGVPEDDAEQIYLGVHLFGGPHYNSD